MNSAFLLKFNFCFYSFCICIMSILFWHFVNFFFFSDLQFNFNWVIVLKNTCFNHFQNDASKLTRLLSFTFSILLILFSNLTASLPFTMILSSTLLLHLSLSPRFLSVATAFHSTFLEHYRQCQLLSFLFPCNSFFSHTSLAYIVSISFEHFHLFSYFLVFNLISLFHFKFLLLYFYLHFINVQKSHTRDANAQRQRNNMHQFSYCFTLLVGCKIEII